MISSGASENSLLELETEVPSTSKSTPEVEVGDQTKVLKDTKKFLPIWARPPWPEWSDDAINRETWEENESIEIFEDPAGSIEPVSLTPSNWIRPSELFVQSPKLIDWTAPIIDLITPNAHICELSEAVRFILSEISELYDYGVENEFLVEGEGSAFKPNSERQGISWKPWDHIYSCCKAGVVGERPVFNSMGKYYVRLYFMGSWRRITVDDRIPLMQNGRIGLPITEKNELWPMILTKALLKIASLTWKDGTGIDEIRQFSSISSLTGWVHEWIDVREPVLSETLWNELTDILPKYKRPAVTSNRVDKGKDDLGEDLEGLWWLQNAAGDKEDDLDYQDYSDSDKAIITVPIPTIIEADDVPPPHSASEEHTPKSKKKLKKKRRKSEYHPGGSFGKINHAEHPSEGEIEDNVKVEDPVKHDKKMKKKNKKEKNHSHDTSAEKHVLKDGKKSKKGKEKGKKVAQKKVSEAKKEIALGDNEGEDSKDIPAQNEEIEISKDEDSKEKTGHKDKSSKNHKNKKMKKDTSSGEAVHKTKGMSKNRKTIIKHHSKDKKGTGAGISEPEDDNHLADENLLLVEDDIHIKEHSPSMTATVIKASIISKLVRRVVSKRHEGASGTPGTGDIERTKSNESYHSHGPKVPRMQDILQGVQKYSGFEYHSLLSSWEAICGKNIPVALTVVLKMFPKPEEDGTLVPSFLNHPMQLIELRDVPLFKESDRPSTPLWKTYRWKAWAMKKGLIPMQKSLNQDSIRSIKVRTPFVLKTDWYDSGMGIVRHEYIGEFGGEDEYMEMVDRRLRSSSEFAPPPVPPTTSVGADTICGGGVEASASIEANVDPTKKQIKSSLNAEAKLSDKSKTIVTSMTKIMGKAGKNKRTSIVKAMSESIEESAIQNNGIKEPENATDDEEWLGEGEEIVEVTDLKTIVPEAIEQAVEVLPTVASGTLWFQCDSLASSIRKLCKFYSSRTTFGSCFILRRNSDWAYSLPGTTNSEPVEAASTLPKDIIDYHAVQGSQNLTIKFDMFKTLSVTPFHLDQSEGIDSAFYLFSDCWTQQEIMITLEVLQDLVIKTFTERALNQENTNTKKRHKNSVLSLSFVLEPWDWRNDCCMEPPLIYASTESSWSTHLTLPAGRNTFRIWLVEEVSRDSGSGGSGTGQKIRKKAEANRKTGIVPFIAKFSSKTPIHVGSREEIQNYMTNEPVLFLKQCERLAQNVWTMFLLFGKSRYTFAKNLRSLRKSYCPSYTEPNIINKRLKGVHVTFENSFVSKIVELNDGKIDRIMLIALKCLLLNPTVGQGYGSVKASRGRTDKKELENLLKSYRKQKKFPAVNSAVLTIQRYCRGWLVRRLFQIRTKGHKLYQRIEFQIRKIALLLAKNTDSAFSGQPSTRDSLSMTEDNDARPTVEIPPPTIVPNPPKWSVDLMRHLLQVHPLLISLHPHAYCIPHHIKIREIQGTLPSFLNHSTWLPFLRQLFFVPGESKWCYCMIDLQVYPCDGVVLKIINNDTQKCLLTSTNQIFLGRLRSNKLGYTMMGYRWAIQPDVQVHSGRVPSNQWKIRIITPNIQESLVFKDELLSHGGQIPRKLSMRRLTGYYLPNKDFSICRYTMETAESSSHLSIRFRTNYEHVKVRLQIWDLTTKTLVLEHTATGGFLLPAVIMENYSGKSQSGSADSTQSSSELRKVQSVGLGSRPNSEFALDSKKRPLTEPGLSSDSGNSQRYAISIFVVDNSWPLTDRQWIFVHHKRRNFFKKLRKWSFKTFRKEKKKQREEATAMAQKSVISPTLSDGVRGEELPEDSNTKWKNKKSRKNKTLVDNQINIKPEVKSEPSVKSEPAAPSKAKSNNNKAKKGKKDDSVQQKISNISKNSKTDTKAPDVQEQSKESIENIKKTRECKHKKVKKDHTHHVKKQVTGNLTVKSGGRHSKKIHHDSQPSWLLEILTDAGKKYKFINSREKFKQELRETKIGWESKGADRLAKGLASRRNYLLRHLVPVNYKATNPFAFVNPMANFYSCLHLEKYDLDGYKENKFIKCLKEGWKKLKKQRKTLLIKHLEKLRKIKDAKKAGSRVTKVDSRFKRKENGVLLKRLKRLPRFLSKRKEQWLKMKGEMDEKAKQDQEAAALEKDQIGSEVDDTALKLQSDNNSVGTISEKLVKTSKTKTKRKTGPLVNPHPDDGSVKNADDSEGHGHAGKKKKGKKDKIEPEKKIEVSETDRSKSKNKKREGSLTVKSTVLEHPADKKRRSKGNNTESKIHKGTTEGKLAAEQNALSEKQIKIDTESQKSKYKLDKHESVKDGLKAKGIVKTKRSKTIRDGLLTARQLHPTSGPSLVRIIRSGGDKYCQLKADKVPVTEVTDTSIGDRLLNWAFNYNCMKKEPLEEDATCGACGDEITLANMALRKTGSGELKKLKDRRFAIPPPKRPTHVLIGPKISKCGLDSKKEQQKRLNGEIAWSLRDKHEELRTQEENNKLWQDKHEKMHTVFENFKADQKEEKNKYIEEVYKAAIERGKKNREAMNAVRDAYARQTSDEDLPSVSGSSDSFDSSDDCETAPPAAVKNFSKQFNSTHGSTSMVAVYETEETGDGDSEESSGTCSDWDEEDDYTNYLQLAMASQSFNELDLDDEEMGDDVSLEDEEHHGKPRLPSFRPHRHSEKPHSADDNEIDMEAISKSTGSREITPLEHEMTEEMEEEVIIET